MSVPCIGVSASSAEAAQPYQRSVESRGARVRLLLPEDFGQAEAMIRDVDALLLSGGPDVDPELYHQRPETGVELALERRRDDLELALLEWALRRDIPVLGICRGMQLLNVAMGGTLLQHLPDHADQWRDGRWESVYHRVYLSPGSKLAAIIGSGGLFRVNSRHHQGLREAQKAPELLTSVYSLEDGVIEGLEMPGERWVIGVQFHPEREEETPQRFGLLFQAFVERAERAVEVGHAHSGRSRGARRQ